MKIYTIDSGDMYSVNNSDNSTIDNLEYISKKYRSDICASHIKDETRKYVNDNNSFKTLENGKVLLLRK